MFRANEKMQKINISYNLIVLLDKLPFHDMSLLPYRDQINDEIIRLRLITNARKRVHLPMHLR